MKKITRFSLYVTSLLFLANFSGQQSGDCPRDYHSKIISGTVDLTDGASYKIDNVSVSGKIDGIELYRKPNKKNTLNPIKSKTALNLIDIKSIEPILNKDGKPAIATYNNRDFVEIDLVWKDTKNPEKYLIERSMRVFGTDANNKKAKKDESIEVIKRLDITGFKERENKEATQEKA